jgi:hypothetical protein
MAAAERRHQAQVAGAVTLEAAATSLVAIVIGSIVAFASLTHAADDPTGGLLAIPWRQLSLVLGGGIALGLLSMIVPAALLGHGGREARLLRLQ